MAQPRPSRGPRRRGSTTALLVLLAAPHAAGGLTLPLFGGGGGPELKTHKRAGGAGNNGSRSGETRMRGAAGLTIDADGAAGLWKMARPHGFADNDASDGSRSRHRQSEGSRHHKFDSLVPFGPVPRGGSLADVAILPPSGAAAAAALTLDQAGGPFTGIRRGAKGARRRILKTTVHLHRALRFGGGEDRKQLKDVRSDTELAVSSSVSMASARAAAVGDGPRSFLRIGGGINRRLQRKRRAARHAKVGAVCDSAVLAASAELSLDVDMEAWTDLEAAMSASSVVEAAEGGDESSSPPLFGVKLFQRKSVEIESHETIAVRLDEAALSSRGGGSAIAVDDTSVTRTALSATSSIASTTSLVSADTYVLETPLFPIILPKAWAPPVASSSSIESVATLEISVALEEDIATTTADAVEARPSPQLLMAAVQPLLPKDAVDTFTGREFYYPESYVSLTATGMTMTLGRGRNPWVEWSGEKKTDAFLRTHGNDGEAGSGPEWYDALDASQEVLVWAGKFTSKEGYGAELPIIKTKSIIHKSPKYLAELLMDSERVKAYNKMSLGRTDEVVFQTGVNARGGEFGDGESKVVRNLTKPPMVSSLIEFVTCMHARKLRPDDMDILGEGDGPAEGYVVVSRAVTGGQWSASDGDRSTNGEKLVRNEILLGVNVLREVPGQPDKTELTAVTHVYSPMIPQMLAKSAGVKGAIDFIRDVRALP